MCECVFYDGEVGVFCVAWCCVLVKRVHVGVGCVFANDKEPMGSVAYGYEE